MTSAALGTRCASDPVERVIPPANFQSIASSQYDFRLATTHKGWPKKIASFGLRCYFRLGTLAKEKDPAAVSLGRKGGRKIAKRGSQYFRELQAKRKNRKGGRPPKSKKSS